MKIGNIIKTGILCTIAANTLSCTKQPLRKIPQNEVPKELVKKLDSISNESKKVLNDTTYHFFGNDTLKISDEIYTNPPKYVKFMNTIADKQTPKVKTGQHLENIMLPKSGGGFDIIPVMKNDYTKKYKNQKAIITDVEIYSRTGKDLYIPVQYYGQTNI